MLAFARAKYDFGRSSEGEVFAVPINGPRIATMFVGGPGSFGAQLSHRYFQEHDQVPAVRAVDEATRVLEAMAWGMAPTKLSLRVARTPTGVVIDLGDERGQAVVVTASGWTVVGSSPVVFRRTELTGAMPEPRRGGDIKDLALLINMHRDDFDLLVAWLVAALLPNLPQPAMRLFGSHGSAKSTAARLAGRLVDPSPAELLSPPQRAEQLAMAAAGAYLLRVDNLSTISKWLSDALCRICTGEAWVNRRLYTDRDLTVLAFLRPVIFTSIEAGQLRGDLADRLIVFELDPISPAKRLAEDEIERVFSDHYATLFGALLDILAGVLRVLRDIHLHELPRMADFARVVASVDRVRGTAALATYLDQSLGVAREVLDDDPVAIALEAFMEDRTQWQGTTAELLKQLVRPTGAPGWPGTPEALGRALRRLLPNLATVGITITRLKRNGRRRDFVIARDPKGDGSDQAAPTVTTPSPRKTRSTALGDGGDGSVQLFFNEEKEERAGGEGEAGSEPEPSQPSQPSPTPDRSVDPADLLADLGLQFDRERVL